MPLLPVSALTLCPPKKVSNSPPFVQSRLVFCLGLTLAQCASSVQPKLAVGASVLADAPAVCPFVFSLCLRWKPPKTCRGPTPGSCARNRFCNAVAVVGSPWNVTMTVSCCRGSSVRGWRPVVLRRVLAPRRKWWTLVARKIKARLKVLVIYIYIFFSSLLYRKPTAGGNQCVDKYPCSFR